MIRGAGSSLLTEDKQEGPVVDSEQAIIERARRGDASAFARIVESYRGFLLAAVKPIVRDQDVAEDILQETFLQVYRSLPGYRGGSFRTWAARIAVNKAIDWNRKAQPAAERRGWEAASRVVPGPSRQVGVEPSAEEELLRRTRLSHLRAALAALPAVYRRTLVRHSLDGDSCAEMASEEGVSVKTVESRLYRARRLLRRRLQEFDDAGGSGSRGSGVRGK